MIYDCMDEKWVATNEETTMAYETYEYLTYNLEPEEFADDRDPPEILLIQYRAYADADYTMCAEAVRYTFGDTTRYVGNDMMSRLCQRQVKRIITDEVLQQIRDDDPAFENMPTWAELDSEHRTY